MSFPSGMEVKPLLTSLSKYQRRSQKMESRSRAMPMSRVTPRSGLKARTVDEFLSLFVGNAFGSLENVYKAEHKVDPCVEDNSVLSSLCEDVYTMVNSQLDLVHEFVKMKKIEKTDAGAQLVMSTLLSTIRNLQKLQLEHRDRFLVDLKSSCAAANDLMRMIECFRDATERVNGRYPGLKLGSLNKRVVHDIDNAEGAAAVERESSDLVALYTKHATYAAEKSHTFLMEVIRDSSIQKDLFSCDWEENILNEVAISIVMTTEDFLDDCYSFLPCTFLYGKLVGAVIRSIVCFYVQSFLRKARRVRRQLKVARKLNPLVSKEHSFVNPRKTVSRMMNDIEVFRAFFCNLVKQMPQLSPLVEKEISVLMLFHDCLMAATESENKDKIQKLILQLHKQADSDITITKNVLKDLWLLARGHTGALDEAFQGIRNDLNRLSENQSKSQCEGSSAQHVYTSPVLSLGEVLKQHYGRNPFQEFFQPFGQNFNVLCNDANAKKEQHGVVQGKENPSAQNKHQDGGDSPDNHEDFKSMIESMVAELSLKNNRFIEERPKLGMQRQVAQRGLRCTFP